MIAIIPARGGSKGLPGKNIKLLNGKPLIAYTIEAALKSKFIEKVYVSTDNAEIAEIARKYGALVPFLRPDFLSTDNAKSSDVIKYMHEWLESNFNKIIPEIIILQPTSPLRGTLDIDSAIQMFQKLSADSVISYCKEHHSIFWHKFLSDENKFENIFSGDLLVNRQELKESYYPNGAIYILNRELIIKNLYYTDNSFAYIMSRENSVDIDTIDDFDYAEFLIKKDKN